MQSNLPWPHLTLCQGKSVQLIVFLLCATNAWWWRQIPAVGQSIRAAEDRTGTVVQQQGDRHRISGGSLSADGHNLFHSFEDFGLNSHEIAEFLAQPNIDNILGRVVGGDISVINGLLQVTGGDANLLLMNPAGIILGPNAQLDVPASFTATTATGIGFGDQWFHAFGDNHYNTLVGNPTQFAFATNQPGSLLNEGTLDVSSSHRIMLLGGSVINMGTLTAPNGTITIAAVPEQHVVRLSQEGMLLNLEFEAIANLDPTTSGLNPVPFTPLSLPELLVGGDRQHHANTIEVAADGTIHLVQTDTTLIPTTANTAMVSGSLNVDSTDVVNTNPAPATSSSAGSITVVGDRVALIDATVTADGMNHGGTIRIGGNHRGLDKLPTAAQTVVDRGSRLSARAIAHGDGGEIIVWSDAMTQVAGEITAIGGADGGHGGFVEVSGQHLDFASSRVDLTANQGEMGTLLIDPLDIEIVDGVGANDGAIATDGTLFADEGTGTFTISATQLEILSGNTNIELEAQRHITINNLADDSLDFAPGPGRITFTADADQNNVGNFTMHSSDRLNTNGRDLAISGVDITLGTVDATGFAQGGDILLDSQGTLTVFNDLTSSTLLPTGAGGEVIATATGSITIGQSGVSDESIRVATTGDGGSISLTSDTGGIAIAGGLNSGSILGTAGNITLDAARDISLGANALQTSINTFGLNAGGNIRVISRNGSVDASAGSLNSVSPNGLAGNVTVEATRDINLGTDRFGDAIYSGGVSQQSGHIRLISQNGDIAIAGALDTVSDTGIAGNVLVQAEGNITLGRDIADPAARGLAISSSGGQTSGSIQIISTLGTIDSRQASLHTVSNGGEAGLVRLDAYGDITLGSDAYGSAILSTGQDIGGNIQIVSQTGQIDARQGSLSSASIAGLAGNVSLDAAGDIFLGDDREGRAIASLGLNRGGDIAITSRGGQIQADQGLLASASAEGTAGRVTVTAAQSVSLDEIVSAGNTAGGTVRITSEQADITIAGGIDSLSEVGTAGAVVLDATGAVTLGDRITSTGRQRGGDIIITTTTAGLDLQDIALESFSDGGTAGAIRLSAQDTIVTSHISSYGNQQGGHIAITAITGDITATETLNTVSITGGAGNVNLTANGTVQTQTIESAGATRGGDIDIVSTTEGVAIAGELNSVSEQGTAGEVTIAAHGNVQAQTIASTGLTNGGRIHVTSGTGPVAIAGDLNSFSEQGTAGRVTIVAERDVQTQSIASTGLTRGGNIDITSDGGEVAIAGDLDSFSEEGTAGGVSITAADDIITRAIISEGQLRGGGVHLTSGATVDLSQGFIGSFSDGGRAGSVEISAVNDITVGAAPIGTAISSDGRNSGGSVDLTSTAGAIQLAGNLYSLSTTGSAGNVTLTAIDDIGVNGDINSQSRQRGGDITMTSTNGGFDASNSSLQSLSAEGTAGNITITTAQDILTGDLNSQGQQRGGDITIEGDRTITTGTLTSQSPQGIAGNITLTAQARIQTIEIASAGDQRGGNITLTSDDDSVTVEDAIESLSLNGMAGDVTITAERTVTSGDILTHGLEQGGDVAMASGDRIDLRTATINSFSEEGIAGSVNLAATGDVHIGGSATTSAIRSEGPQQGGDITIISRQNGVAIEGSLDSFSADGSAGDVSIQTQKPMQLAQSIRSEGTENGGNITLRTATAGLDLTGVDLISESSLGTAGDVTLEAAGNISAGAVDSAGAQRGGDITITSQAAGITTNQALNTLSTAGMAGQVTLNAATGIATTDILSSGQTQGGDIRLNAGTGAIATTGTLNSFSAQGKAGSVTATATGPINLLSIASQGPQQGGDITITSTTAGITVEGSLASFSDQGNAGSVTLSAIQDVALREANPTIRSLGLNRGGDIAITSTDGGFISEGRLVTLSPEGVAGTVTITTRRDIQVADGDRKHSIRSRGQEQGGDIALTSSDGSILTVGALVSASNAGEAGDVTLTANGDITLEGHIDEEWAVRSRGEDVGGDITLTSESGGISVNGSLISFSPDGIAGNVTVVSDRTIRLSEIGDDWVIRSQGLEQGGNVNLISRDGQIRLEGDVNSFSLDGIGGRVELEANGRITVGDIRTFGNLESGNVQIDSRLGRIRTGNIATIAPNGTSGAVIFSALGNIITGNVISTGITSGDITFTSAEGTILTGAVYSATGAVEVGQHSAETATTTATSLGGEIVTDTQEAIAEIEEQREHEFSTYFGRDLAVETMTPEAIQGILATVYEQTGNTSAIVYVTAPYIPADSLLKQTENADESSSLFERPLELLVFTLDADPIRITIPDVGRDELFTTISEFRNQLIVSERRGNHHYLPAAQRLYDWLIAPLEAELGAETVDTLLFSMDSGLRGLPIAALHDGQQFLIEKYSMGMVPSVGLMDTQYRPLGQADVLAMGADTFTQQNPLPAVPIEVGTITQIRGGTAFLNEAFTQENLTQQRQQTPYRIIHLATHAAFNPGTVDNSYIQLWGDERLDLSEVQALGWDNPAVDLLVLSACQTAVGNPDAELGFAGLAVASGVRSALASLWAVSDEGTLALMTDFYDHLNQATVKSEALRQSQLAMLHGQTRIEDGRLVRSQSHTVIELPDNMAQEGRDLSHPYYWSGFTMIGSPW